MINFYEAECKRQKDQDVNKVTIPLGDDREMTQALQHFVDCVKHNLSGEQQLRYCQSFYVCIYQIFYATHIYHCVHGLIYLMPTLIFIVLVFI